ncbi:MAG: DUF433 domain-containing protein [Thermoanaerobaculia bacterium]
MLANIKEHIDATPGVCGGKPRIAGHRIRVADVVVCHEHQGMSPDEIVANYPGLTLADVYAALAYYFDHRDEIRNDIAEERRFAEEMRRKTPSVLQAKLQRRRAG